MRLPELDPDPRAPFPDPGTAPRQPDGLLAWGGDLGVTRLLNAYRSGIFPWFNEGDPPLWWSPDPRVVFDTDGVHLSRRLRRSLRSCDWRVEADRDFDAVIAGCATTPRRGQRGTWIVPAMRRAYVELHRAGHAHCVEVRDAGDRLVGGIYGVAVGRMFFGESMFGVLPGASSLALAALARGLAARGWPLIDAQLENPHLMRLGARRMPRPEFLAMVARLVAQEQPAGSWRDDWPATAAAGLA